jgi:hypothetical protein
MIESPAFEVVPDPPADLRVSVAQLSPTNAFYTNAYIAYRRDLGDLPYLLLVRKDGELIAGCTAFEKTGRLGRSLEITSLPGIGDNEFDCFWDGLRSFCKARGITQLSVHTFSSPASRIPSLQGERWRKRRVEYKLGLLGPDLWKHMRKGHMWNVKQGRKAGLTVRIAIDQEACIEHARLIEASMTRRMDRGEEVSNRSDPDKHWALVRTGAAKVFQAVRGGHVVSSNLVLLSARGGYNHSQGTNREGMAEGAAHFLIYEIATILRVQSFEVFNLGGTDQLESGLERSKNEFGATTTRLELESLCLSEGSCAPHYPSYDHFHASSDDDGADCPSDGAVPNSWTPLMRLSALELTSGVPIGLAPQPVRCMASVHRTEIP